MPLTPARRGLYLDFFALLHPRIHHPRQCQRRWASTTSAIRRGLLATQEADRQRSGGRESRDRLSKRQGSDSSASRSALSACALEQPNRTSGGARKLDSKSRSPEDRYRRGARRRGKEPWEELVDENTSGNAKAVDLQREEKLFDVTSPPRSASASHDNSPSDPRIRRTQGHAPLPGGAASSKPSRAAHDGHDQTLSIPYTTSSSIFLYGTNPVLAALRANRRKLHRLYYRSSHNNPVNTNPHAEIFELARRLKIPISPVSNPALLDKMSQTRPHNGIVLESSRLPAPPVLSLGKVDQANALLPLTLAPQTTEDFAVNGAPLALSLLRRTPQGPRRYPLIVLIDGITDEGNLGNILRTAHFFGVTAVAVSTPTCTDINSAIVAKASAGACEAVRLLALPRPASFVADSARAGWRVYAAVAPPEPGRASARDVGRSVSLSDVAEQKLLEKHPVILMLGSEGRGLPDSLSRKADRLVSIRNYGRLAESVVDVGVDSLNVSVAAGVLIEAFLREGKSDAKGAGEVGRRGKRREKAFTDEDMGFVPQDEVAA